ncbi:unnamed protein product, partial [Mesorhabditis spiculigera]
MQRLDCHVKEYAWGKKGEGSEVANLFAAGHCEFLVDKFSPYAELWMGTHPDGAARLASSKQLLSSFIAKQAADCQFNNNLRKDVHLPFIMKVMSIAKTLSLQVHPTKEQAERLHDADPQHYPDRHHKPELAYALTKFELLCGFRPAHEIAANLRAFKCLRSLMGNSERLIDLIEMGVDPRSNKCKSRLAACFAYQLAQPKDQVEDLVDELMADLARGVRGALREDTVAVIEKTCSEFPGDVGLFAPLYLNHMVLQPGQCCYYASQELHAYLSGECVECVGCSNNTIRAALTPKYVDHDALVEALNYQMTHPDDYLVPARRLPAYPIVDEYAPDCRDFQLHRVQVEPNSTLSPLPPLDCASIMVVVKGYGVMDDMKPGASNEAAGGSETRTVARGDIIYIPPGRRVCFTKCFEKIEAYRTFSYETGPEHEIMAPDAHVLSSASQKISPVPLKGKTQVIITPKLDRNDSGIVFEVESEMDGFC